MEENKDSVLKNMKLKKIDNKFRKPKGKVVKYGTPSPKLGKKSKGKLDFEDIDLGNLKEEEA